MSAIDVVRGRNNRSRWTRRAAGVVAALGVLLTGQALGAHATVISAHADTNFDQALLTLVNGDRAQYGEAPVRWNATLGAIGENQPWGGCGFTVAGRALDLLQRNYFSHTICGTHNVFDVMRSNNLPFGWAGENIGWESGVTDPLQAAQYLNQQFMNSQDHRDNILNANFTDMGVGSAATAPGATWSGGGARMSNVFITAEVFASLPGSTVPAAALPASHNGYWMTAGDGAVFDFGAPGNYGQESGGRLNQPIVGMAPTADGNGYWLVARDGGVFPHGDAVGYGSTGNIRLNQPVVGMAATPDGHGYWLVASDGGIFPFGDAGGYGSTGNVRLNRPVVGMAATPDGHGYWLVASDGGIFPFGNAAGMGSAGNVRLNQPIVGMARTHSGNGYWMVAADGGIFPFGDATGMGSTGGTRLNAPMVAMTIG